MDNVKVQLSGVDLDRKWFIDVLGWEFDEGSKTWLDKDGKFASSFIPAIHRSLDLQEKWLWPKLIEAMVHSSKFVNNSLYFKEPPITCHLEKEGCVSTIMASADDKPMSQERAAIRAMGQEI